MNIKTKITLIVTIFFGLLFLGLGIYQWYDLYLIEQGEKEGSLSIVLHQIYQIAGKWGVALVYMPFTVYCFWRAYIVYKHYKYNNEYGSYEEEEETTEEKGNN